MRNEKVSEPRKKLPIPLTCNPQVQDGKCIHGFDNGACRLSNQFMCPYYLWFEREHPEKVGDAPKEIVDQILVEQPISLGIPAGLFQIRIKYKLDGKVEHGKKTVKSAKEKTGRLRSVSAGRAVVRKERAPKAKALNTAIRQNSRQRGAGNAAR
jgi:hypothetical protein